MRMDQVGPRQLHLIGIGGSGLSSLAAYLLQRGDRVSGCENKSGELLERLRRAGAQVDLGHDAKHLDGQVDLVVHTAALSADHPELQEARRRGIPTMKYARFLGVEMERREGVAVAG